MAEPLKMKTSGETRPDLFGSNLMTSFPKEGNISHECCQSQFYKSGKKLHKVNLVKYISQMDKFPKTNHHFLSERKLTCFTPQAALYKNKNDTNEESWKMSHFLNTGQSQLSPNIKIK